MAWRRARSLAVLHGEIEQIAPGTTVWDIGDADHQERDSDHNPNAAGVVCAIDVLDNAGLNLWEFAERLRKSNHPALKYVIYQARIASRGGQWRDYTGAFHSHAHVSVGVGPDGQSTGPYDDQSPWLTEEDHMSWSQRIEVSPTRAMQAATALGLTVKYSSRTVRQSTELLAGQTAILARLDGQPGQLRAELDRSRRLLLDAVAEDFADRVADRVADRLSATVPEEIREQVRADMRTAVGAELATLRLVPER